MPRSGAILKNKSTDTSSPAGAILPFASRTCPTGWLVCDGSAVSRSTYSKLFAAIGTAHGVGNGSTTFNVPDYRGRFIRGTDNMSSGFSSAAKDPNRTTRQSATVGTFNLTNSNVVSGLSEVTVSSTANLAPGMSVTGSGIPAGTSVVVHEIMSSTIFRMADIDGNIVYGDSSFPSTTLTFSNSATANYIGSIQDSELKSHRHDYFSGGTAAPGEYGYGDSNLNNLGSNVSAIGSTGGLETRPINIYANYIIKI